MDTTEQRVEFEAAYVEDMVRIIGEGIRKRAIDNTKFVMQNGDFQDPALRLAFWAWQAGAKASTQVDLPSETGHAIPQWLRDRFDAIELEVRKMGAEGVFTQMRTKVQAYFEMLRSVERGKAGRDMHIIAQQKNLIASLRSDLQEAISIDCDDDVIDACAEVERTGTPGSVIREMNDELVDLRTDAERFQFIAKDAESSLERIYGDDWLAVVDQMRGVGEKP
ncbi:hypothetical protein YA0850_01315 [Pseudomonas veronii]|uniref:DUF3486 family protein n=1 Tax=Pseudomonas veronii TaxID=76761 RepID=A0ABS0VCB9_PSEVE|nr:hypothetical protein [Pseudomonas veronii]MBI6551064.1 hypothetical protein [Pseudomonas veronii]MBI6649162.1 hypothetical protein [Pseudomonas veronii]